MKERYNTYRKAFLVTVFLAAVLAGIISILYPAWECRQGQGEQEGILLRLEQQAGIGADGRKLPAPGDKGVCLPVSVRPSGTEVMPVPEEGDGIGILVIPKIKARLPVTAGVAEEQLSVSEGWVMQTAFIGSEGNAVVAGHRSYTWGRHFNRLGELEAGDEIFFTGTCGETMRFVVSEILVAGPDDPAVFAAPPAGMAQLTLYTCTPVGIATHRLIVQALLEE